MDEIFCVDREGFIIYVEYGYAVFQCNFWKSLTRFLPIAFNLLLRRFVFRIVEASTKRKWLVMNRKEPWEGYRR